MIIFTFFLAAQSVKLAAFNTIYSLPKKTTYLSLTLKVFSAKFPYAYPRLDLCLTMDSQAWQFGLEYQYVWSNDIVGDMAYYRVSSNSTSIDGYEIEVLLLEASVKTCSPQCIALGNTCQNNKCVCKPLYVGESCSVYLNRIASGVVKQAVIKPSFFPTIFEFVFNQQDLESIQQLSLESESPVSDNYITVYIKESSSLTPPQLASPVTYDSKYKLEQKLQIAIPKLKEEKNQLSIAVVQDLNARQVKFRFQFLAKSSVVLAVLMGILGALLLAAIGYLVYKYIYLPKSQPQHYTDDIALKKYFPSVKYQVVSTLLKQNNKNEDECSFCISKFTTEQKVSTTYCFHVFHTNCLHLWFKKNAHCPNCRKDHALSAVQKYYESLNIEAQCSEEQIIKRICISTLREVSNQTDRQIQ